MVFASNENTDILTVDSLTANTLKCHEIKNPYRFRPTQLIIPGVLISAGFVGLKSNWLKYTNHETKEELQEHPHSKLGVDDFSQYAPLAAAYGLRLCGINGLHDYVDDCDNIDRMGIIRVLHPFISWGTLSLRYSFWNSYRKFDGIFLLFYI